MRSFLALGHLETLFIRGYIIVPYQQRQKLVSSPLHSSRMFLISYQTGNTVSAIFFYLLLHHLFVGAKKLLSGSSLRGVPVYPVTLAAS